MDPYTEQRMFSGSNCLRLGTKSDPKDVRSKCMLENRALRHRDFASKVGSENTLGVPMALLARPTGEVMMWEFIMDPHTECKECFPGQIDGVWVGEVTLRNAFCLFRVYRVSLPPPPPLSLHLHQPPPPLPTTALPPYSHAELVLHSHTALVLSGRPVRAAATTPPPL